MSISAQIKSLRARLRLLDRGTHRLSHILDIMRVEAGHADAAILGHVDVPLVAEGGDLGLGQPGEAEHADLAGDVGPGARGVEFLEVVAQGLAHLDDAAAHGAEVAFPLAEEGGVVEDAAGDAGAVGGRVGDLAALEDGELAGDAGGGVLGGGGVGGAGAGDEVEGARSFAVEAEVFGVGLRHAEFEAFLDEVANGPGVFGEVAGCEALVGAVEEGEVAVCSYDLGDLFPLILCWVDPGGVVCAGMEQDDAAFGGGGDC